MGNSNTELQKACDDLPHFSSGNQTLSLGIGKDHARSWKPREAFREFYQNWKDAIIDSFNMNPRSFTPIVEETREGITIKVYKQGVAATGPTLADLAGYIIYFKSGSQVNKKENVELVNLNSRLERAYVTMGASGKRQPKDKDKFAGCHGEGFKSAALVLCREKFSVRFITNAEYWNFRLNKYNMLCCGFNRAAQSAIEKNQKEAETKRSPFPFDILKDVSVTITSDQPIDFKDWCTVSMDLHQPRADQTVSTRHGLLILDPNFASHLYLKGLSINSQHSALVNGSLAYGYNIFSSPINRDRDYLTAHDENYMLIRIWTNAIETDPSETVIDRYVELFSRPEECAELSIGKKLPRQSVEKIWRRLRQSSPEVFFYGRNKEDSSKDREKESIIRNDLRKTPLPLHEALWRILNQSHLPRTPQDERIRQFASSQEILPDLSVFQQTIWRVLKATFLVHPNTKDMKIMFVRAASIDVDVHFDSRRNLIQIHEKWLSFELIHRDGSCPAGYRGLDNDVFYCDHVLDELFEIIVQELRQQMGLANKHIRHFRQTFRERLRGMPRKVSLVAHDAGVLTVSWMTNESQLLVQSLNVDIKYRVELHRMSSCAFDCPKLIHRDDHGSNQPDQRENATMRCGCRFQTVALPETKVTFTNVARNDTYYAIVCRSENGSFLGLPSAQSQAHTQSIGLRTPSEQNSTPRQPPAVRQPKVFESERVWLNWCERGLMEAFSRLLSSRCMNSFDMDHYSVASCTSERLGFEFETFEYSLVRLSSDPTTNLIVYIHGINTVPDNSEIGQKCYLIVTKFSYISAVNPFKHSLRENFNPNELLLHYSKYSAMGRASDGEVIELKDIVHAESIGSVQYVSKTVSEGESEPALYCRFGVSTSASIMAVSWTPLAPHLMLPQHRYKWKKYAEASKVNVLDFTPGVLGPSEGLEQAGSGIKTKIMTGFEQAHHMTWKVRHHASAVYEKSPSEILQALRHGQCSLPTLESESETPRIALAATSTPSFEMLNFCKDFPDPKQLLEPLRTICAAVESPLNPDFGVMVMPAEVLHHSANEEFDQLIQRLLESERSVHTMLVPLKALGIPQARSVILIVTVPRGVGFEWLDERLSSACTVHNTIQDLAFKTPGAISNNNLAFEHTHVDSHANNRRSLVYNHQTDRYAPSTPEEPKLDWNGIISLKDSLYPITHPTRNDQLTVREMARLQGFPDDFVFYSSEACQIQDVCKAQPPAVTKLAGKLILRALRSALATRDSVAAVPAKRRRADPSALPTRALPA